MFILSSNLSRYSEANNVYIYIYIQKICDYVICLKIYNMYEVVGKRAEFTGRDFQVEVSAGFL